MNAKIILQQTVQKIEGAYSHATIRAYRADFLDFITFCENRNEIALPGSEYAVAAYIDRLVDAGRKSASIRRAVAGIASIHQLNNVADPTKQTEARLAMRRMHRKLGRFSHQAQGIRKDTLKKMLAVTGSSLRGIRDRAILMLAYETLCRRSELISIRIEDIHRQSIETDSTHLITSIFLRKSKTDQEANGKWLRISEETSHAMQTWLKASKLKSGLLFRGVNTNLTLTDKLDPGNISRIYKRIGKAAQLDQELIRHISGHSTRVGAAQDLLVSGVSLPMLMSRGRWSKSDTVMRYVEQVGFTI